MLPFAVLDYKAIKEAVYIGCTATNVSNNKDIFKTDLVLILKVAMNCALEHLTIFNCKNMANGKFLLGMKHMLYKR